MTQYDFSRLSDEELLEQVRKNKPSPIFDAFFIGFLLGVIVFGAAASAWGFTLLIPLVLIYLFLKKPKRYEAMQKELKARGLQA